MSGGDRWDQLGLPHKGWHCVDVVDLRGDGQSAEETDYETCQMCGKEEIRYLHIMEHPEQVEPLEVGCVCAEKMSDDLEGPKRREAVLKSRASRRARWLQRRWRVSKNGNYFLNTAGYNLGVHSTKTGRWGYRIEGQFGAKTYSNESEAMMALFDEFWEVTSYAGELMMSH